MGKMYNYEAPVVEIIEVEVEKGFATSPGDQVNTGGNQQDMGVGTGSF